MTPQERDEGIVWGHRLLLNREPQEADTSHARAQDFATWQQIRAFFIATPAFRDRFAHTGSLRAEPAVRADLRAGILWAYRLYLLRDPDTSEIDHHAARIGSISDLRTRFLLSAEFEQKDGSGHLDLREVEILNRFAPFCEAPAPEKSFHDFLGARTRLDHLPEGHAFKSGTVEGPPRSPRRGMHGTAEWIATLRSVLEAKHKIVAVELGAGWAPWLVSAAIAAKKIGIGDIALIGVEGSAEHVAFARQHFRDNGLDPDAHRVLHAVVGPADGVARFPRLLQPNEHYGAKAAFGEGDAEEGPGLGAWEEIRSISLATLLRDVDHVDIMHVDIQGSEVEVLRAGIEILNEKVRRVVVGTHGRGIEGALLELFSVAGWRLEDETACIVVQDPSGAVVVKADGEQVWRNQDRKPAPTFLARVFGSRWTGKTKPRSKTE